jgi:hypothetical protein
VKVLKDEFSNHDLAKELENEVSVLTYGPCFSSTLEGSARQAGRLTFSPAVACGIPTVCYSLDTRARLSSPS